MYLRLSLCLILGILIIITIFSHISNNTNESFNNYERCKDKGLSKEFCSIKPFLQNTCVCKNNVLGRQLPGSKGSCICQDNKINKMVKYVDQYTDDLLSGEFGNLPGTFGTTPIPGKFDSYRNEKSNLDNFFYKRSLLQNVENIIPYTKFGSFSFF